MRARVAGLMLAGALSTTKAEAQGVVTGPPVLYTGCVQGDLTACTSFWFAFDPNSAGPYWIFTPPTLIQGTTFFWHVLEDFGYQSKNGKCSGATRDYYFVPTSCVVKFRHQITFTGSAARFDGHDQFRENVVFSPAAAVAPEPATLVLLGTGLAGLVAARRGRQ